MLSEMDFRRRVEAHLSADEAKTCKVSVDSFDMYGGLWYRFVVELDGCCMVEVASDLEAHTCTVNTAAMLAARLVGACRAYKRERMEPRFEPQDVLVMTVGLPRSGKTTWATMYSIGINAPIVNPDSVRLALHGQRYIAEAEPFVWATAKIMVRALFLAGHKIVVLDATNTTRARRDEWRSSRWRRAFHVLDTSCQECQRRAADDGDSDIMPIIDRMAAAFEPVQDDEWFEFGKQLPSTSSSVDWALG